MRPLKSISIAEYPNIRVKRNFTHTVIQQQCFNGFHTKENKYSLKILLLRVAVKQTNRPN